MLLVETLGLSPRESIAMDELMLDKAVAGEVGETLRLWSAPRHFIVLGRNCTAEGECHLGRCRQEKIPIVQRISGGGTVLQGPGCLNFSVIVDTHRDPRLADIKESYQVILGRIVEGLRAQGIDGGIRCCSDLAIGDLKISGNAQFRRRGFLLHHGTLLCEFNLRRINRYLKHPPKEPPYRQGRKHGAFITNLPLDEEQTKSCLHEAWGPYEGVWTLGEADRERLGRMAAMVPIYSHAMGMMIQLGD